MFPSTLPTKRDSTYSGWVSISVGCNNTCTFCIVPALRGKEKDRRPGDILAEIQALVDDGAIEVTLLGQNVNSYGVEFGDRQAFGKLLRAAGADRGTRAHPLHQPAPGRLHRRRHRRHGRDARRHAAAAHAAAVRLRPHPEGDAPLATAPRSSSASSTACATRIPNAAITTDIIVGFPGETEEDFQETLRVVEAARFASAFTFQYSIRPGTPAATMPDQVPKAVVQERYERLVALQERISWEENQRLVGRTGRGARRHRRGQEGRRDAPPQRPRRGQPPRALRGARPAPSCRAPATSSPSTVTQAAPFHLIADSADGAPLRDPPHPRRRRLGPRAGRVLRRAGRAGASDAGRVSLGLPTLRARGRAARAPGVGTMPIYDASDAQR